MVNAYGLHVAGTLIPSEIPIVETGGAPKMRGSGGYHTLPNPSQILIGISIAPGLTHYIGWVLLRCLSKSSTVNLRGKCTPARTSNRCPPNSDVVIAGGHQRWQSSCCWTALGSLALRSSKPWCPSTATKNQGTALYNLISTAPKQNREWAAKVHSFCDSYDICIPPNRIP